MHLISTEGTRTQNIQKVLDKMPRKQSDKAQGNEIPETEIRVVEPSQALFGENTDKEHSRAG